MTLETLHEGCRFAISRFTLECSDWWTLPFTVMTSTSRRLRGNQLLSMTSFYVPLSKRHISLCYPCFAKGKT